MRPLRVLLTSMTLATRTGAELFLRDLAVALLGRGHTPLVYTPDPGPLADELRRRTVPVVTDLAHLPHAPDVIHGNHHPETMTALLTFPAVPAVHVCHAYLGSVAAPPRHPRVRLHVAVDDACRDRLLYEHAVPEDRVRVLLNWVDLQQFTPRQPLPARPRRALLFSNYARDGDQLDAVREACRRTGLALDVVGAGVANGCDTPESILGQYDLVFAKAKCALEAMAVGCAVVLTDPCACGPLVRSADVDRMRRLNFGRRLMQQPYSVEWLVEQIERYDAADAGEVSRQVRDLAGLDAAVEEWLGVYDEVIEIHTKSPPLSAEEELRHTAAYLHWSNTVAKDLRAYEQRATAAEAECRRLTGTTPPATPRLQSGLCNQAQLESPAFREWVRRLGLTWVSRRKLWEYAFICQALAERGLLRPGARGLGFAVGREPLPALFASLGCEVVATDLPAGHAQASLWTTTGQHAGDLAALARPAFCDPREFDRLVRFRAVDMNAIPDDLTGFDFVWSSCSFEHLGSIRHGKRFIQAMTRCLRPGGVAVHTTEFNLSSNIATIDNNPGYVIFRRRDVEEMASSLRQDGHAIDLDFRQGDGPLDRRVDRPPYDFSPHLRLELGGFVATSIGLIVHVGEGRPARAA